MFESTLTFALGIYVSIYMGQNYDQPDIINIGSKDVKFIADLERASKKEDPAEGDGRW